MFFLSAKYYRYLPTASTIYYFCVFQSFFQINPERSILFNFHFIDIIMKRALVCFLH